MRLRISRLKLVDSLQHLGLDAAITDQDTFGFEGEHDPNRKSNGEQGPTVKSLMPVAEHPGPSVQDGSKRGNLLASEDKITLIDCFIDPRDHYGGVTCVSAGRIDRMPKPRSARQSIREKKSSFGTA